MSAKPGCYLDNNATTRVDPEVVTAMLPFLTDRWGNPSSAYGFGRGLGPVLDHARQSVARLIGADPAEIVFTSGGTESINTAFHLAVQARPGCRHILTTIVEHSAGHGVAQQLAQRGYDVTSLPVNADGALDLQQVADGIRSDTALVSIMWANNETGALFPIEEIARLTRSKGVLLHTDAVQAVGKVPVSARAVDVDFLSMSAHKIHGPKGIGSLYIRTGTPQHSLILGGSQENGRRGGTENVAGIVGFGRAADLALEALPLHQGVVQCLRDRLEATVLDRVPGTSRIASAEPRLPNTALLCFPEAEAESLLIALDRRGICASGGSACLSGSLTPSRVLTAMGLDARKARSCVRFSLSRETTAAEIDLVAGCLPSVVAEVRGAVPRADEGPGGNATGPSTGSG
jgi:cysteine desulfurase